MSPAALAVTNQKVHRAYSPIVIAGAVRIADFVLIASIGIALYLGYVVKISGFYWEYIAAILGMTAAAIVCFQAADIYEMEVFRGQLRQMTRMISSWAFVFLLFIGASFVAKLGNEVSRLWLASFFFAGLAALVAERVFVRSLVRSWARQGRLDRRTIIVGSDKNGEELVEALKTQDDSDIRVLGVFDDRNDSRALDTCAGSPKLGKVDDIVEFARRTRVDLVLFALPISAETRILEMLKKLWVLPVDIRLSAHTNKLRFRPRSYSYVGDVPNVPVKGLLDPAYVAARAALIKDRAGPPPSAGTPPGAVVAAADATDEVPGTSHFVIIDGDGNAVSMTTTVESYFGSGRMVDGFFLNNQMTDFSFVPTGPNAIAPGKRPRSSMTPLVILHRDRSLAGAIGSPGGNAILAYVSKALIGVIDWGLPLQKAVALPNLVARGTTFAGEESRFPPAMRAEMARRGVEVRAGSGEESGLHGVMIRDGGFDGAADPRRDGVARTITLERK